MARILVVEDDPKSASRLARLLETEGYAPTLAGSGRTALAYAARAVPDLILLDENLPDCGGAELCRVFREQPSTTHVPIIMVTPGPTTDAEASGNGADDCVTQPFDDAELLARIRTHLVDRAEEPDISPRTQLPGATSVDRFLESLIRGGRTFAVLWLDVDDFGTYNDHYGFRRGDEVLSFVASLLSSASNGNGGGQSDLVGHIGGDDFVVVTEPERVARYCQKIIRDFDTGIGEHYDEEDRQRRCIVTTDGDGRTRTHPIITISISVVSNEYRRIASKAEVAEIAAQLQRLGKRMPRSSYHIDKRRSPPTI